MNVNTAIARFTQSRAINDRVVLRSGKKALQKKQERKNCSGDERRRKIFHLGMASFIFDESKPV